jgi:putative glycosyltransferase
MKLSIVATLYQSAPYISDFFRRVTDAARSMTDDYEIVLVNDGSPDDSLSCAIRLTELDSHVVVVDLSRNFGHHKAMMTGLSYTHGEQIFLIDSDLEEEPEWLIEFAEQLAKDNCDVVYGVQHKRKGGFFERWSGSWFWRLFNYLTEMDLPENIVTSRLMTRRYVNALLLHCESEIFLAGLMQITGFKQSKKIVKKNNTSKTSYTLRRKLSASINAITSFSHLPLISIFWIGSCLFLFALIYLSFILINYFIFSKPLIGWTSLIASVWLLGGLIISFIGILGIYLSRIFLETKHRPITIVRHVYRGDNF